MTSPFEAECPLAAVLASRLRSARAELTTRWLDRISARVAVDRTHVFPTDDLLDHVPLLIDGVADYIENPAAPVTGEVSVIAKAMELGELRYEQGFGEHEIQKEYEIFGGILFTFLRDAVDAIEEPCTRSELLACAHRLFEAVTLIQQATATEYHALTRARLAEREERLRAFNRALTHELRNRIGAALGAGQLLALPDLPPERRGPLAGVVVRNADSMRAVLENLLELSRVDEDARQQRHVRLPEAAREAARQLRDAAAAAGVELRIARDLPDVEVNAGAVELCLGNLISNAIKYRDPGQHSPWVAVRGRILDESRERAVAVEVADNGVGVPPALRSRLFERFYRAHGSATVSIEGTGLGLSIVRDTVRGLGGRAWAEFPADGGSVFTFTVPVRRAEDAQAQATAPTD